jgi:hypothetical protein
MSPGSSGHSDTMRGSAHDEAPWNPAGQRPSKRRSLHDEQAQAAQAPLPTLPHLSPTWLPGTLPLHEVPQLEPLPCQPEHQPLATPDEMRTASAAPGGSGTARAVLLAGLRRAVSEGRLSLVEQLSLAQELRRLYAEQQRAAQMAQVRGGTALKGRPHKLRDSLDIPSVCACFAGLGLTRTSPCPLPLQAGHALQALLRSRHLPPDTHSSHVTPLEPPPPPTAAQPAGPFPLPQRRSSSGYPAHEAWLRSQPLRRAPSREWEPAAAAPCKPAWPPQRSASAPHGQPEALPGAGDGPSYRPQGSPYPYPYPYPHPQPYPGMGTARPPVAPHPLAGARAAAAPLWAHARVGWPGAQPTGSGGSDGEGGAAGEAHAWRQSAASGAPAHRSSTDGGSQLTVGAPNLPSGGCGGAAEEVVGRDAAAEGPGERAAAGGSGAGTQVAGSPAAEPAAGAEALQQPAQRADSSELSRLSNLERCEAELWAQPLVVRPRRSGSPGRAPGPQPFPDLPPAQRHPHLAGLGGSTAARLGGGWYVRPGDALRHTAAHERLLRGGAPGQPPEPQLRAGPPQAPGWAAALYGRGPAPEGHRRAAEWQMRRMLWEATAAQVARQGLAEPHGLDPAPPVDAASAPRAARVVGLPPRHSGERGWPPVPWAAHGSWQPLSAERRHEGPWPAVPARQVAAQEPGAFAEQRVAQEGEEALGRWYALW